MDCWDPKSPILIVDADTLRNQIMLLKPKLYQNDYDFVCSPNDISSYYRHELACCNVNTNHNYFTVSLTIPIKRKLDTYSVMTGILMPFIHNNPVCQSKFTHFEIIFNNRIPRYAHNLQAFECNHEKSLFYLKFIRNLNFDMDYLCIKNLLSFIKSDKNMNYCSLVCRNLTNNELLVLQVSSLFYANLLPTAKLKRFKTPQYSSTNILSETKLRTAPGSFLPHLKCNCIAILNPSITIEFPLFCRNQAEDT